MAAPPPKDPGEPGTQTLGEAVEAVQVIRWSGGPGTWKVSDRVAVEEPLEIRIRGKSIAVTMRTPGHDGELAAGFLVSEGLIRGPSDLVEIAPCRSGDAALHGNIVNVFLSPAVRIDFEQLTRHVFASSSCGLCGKTSIAAVQGHFPRIQWEGAVEASVISTLPNSLRAKQEGFAKTGGLHAAGLFDVQGHLQVIREDVGRHNAVDKVLGWMILNRSAMPHGGILMVSGRASFEIMQKAAAGRIPVVAAVSAPSSLAIDFARDGGQTLVGFVRDGSFNVYSEPDRVRFGPRPTSGDTPAGSLRR